jgi:hypothetical protein
MRWRFTACDVMENMMYSKAFARRIVIEAERHDKEAENALIEHNNHKSLADTIRASIPAELYAETKKEMAEKKNKAAE